MAWEAAGFAAALAFLAAAGFIAYAAFRIGRALARWDHTAERLARKADAALDEYIRLAQQTRETAESACRSIEGFSRLADGARAVGDAAESAALAAVHAAYAWRDRFASWMPETESGTGGGQPQDLAEMLRHLLARLLRSRIVRDRRPGASADQGSGE